jgi:hypothetical protein
MQTQRLRWLIKQYGNFGVLLVGTYLLGRYVWTSRRPPFLIMMLCLFAIPLWLYVGWVKPSSGLPFTPQVPPSVPATHRLPLSHLTGTYVCSQLFQSKRLMLSSDGSFHYVESACEGIYLKATGRISVEQDEVVPTWLEIRGEFVHSRPLRWKLVSWNACIYLVEPHQMLGFCQRARKKIPRVWEPYFCKGKIRPDRPLPKVPALYQRYLSEPFVAEVISTPNPHSILINRGREEGVVDGTLLSASELDNAPWYVESERIPWYKVKQVWENSALCERVHDGDKHHMKRGERLGILAL